MSEKGQHLAITKILGLLHGKPQYQSLPQHPRSGFACHTYSALYCSSRSHVNSFISTARPSLLIEQVSQCWHLLSGDVTALMCHI